MIDRVRLVGMIVLGFVILSGIVWGAQVTSPGGGASSGKNPGRSGPAKVDINTASADDLERLPGISNTLSQRIIANRPYRKIDDLVRRRVLGRKQLAAIKEQIVVGDSLKAPLGKAAR